MKPYKEEILINQQLSLKRKLKVFCSKIYQLYSTRSLKTKTDRPK